MFASKTLDDCKPLQLPPTPAHEGSTKIRGVKVADIDGWTSKRRPRTPARPSDGRRSRRLTPRILVLPNNTANILVFRSTDPKTGSRVDDWCPHRPGLAAVVRVCPVSTDPADRRVLRPARRWSAWESAAPSVPPRHARRRRVSRSTLRVRRGPGAESGVVAGGRGAAPRPRTTDPCAPRDRPWRGGERQDWAEGSRLFIQAVAWRRRIIWGRCVYSHVMSLP